MCHVNSLFVRFRWKAKDSIEEVIGVGRVEVAEQCFIKIGTQRDLVEGVLLVEVLDDLRGLFLVY